MTLPWYALGGIACLLQQAPIRGELSDAFFQIQSELLGAGDESTAIGILRTHYTPTEPRFAWAPGLFNGLTVRFATLPPDVEEDEMVLTSGPLYLSGAYVAPSKTVPALALAPGAAAMFTEAALRAADERAYHENAQTQALLGSATDANAELRSLLNQSAFAMKRKYSLGVFTAQPETQTKVIDTSVEVANGAITLHLGLNAPEKSESFADYPCGSTQA